MANGLILFAIWWVPVIALALFLQLSGKSRIAWGWIALAMASHALYASVGAWTLPDNVAELPAEARWLSRIAQLAAGIIMVAFVWKRSASLEPESMGLTAKQAKGSLPWSAAGITALAMLGTIPGGFAPGAEPLPGAGAALYQLTLPGIEEEIFYRALLLGLFATAMGGGRSALLWAGVMSWMIFALAHGVTLADGSVAVNTFILGYVGLAGGVLTIMRIKSGSILLTMLAHNMIGFAGRFA